MTLVLECITNEAQALLPNIILKVVPYLNEKQKRLFLGIIASELGHGGVAFVKSVSHTARQTIINGATEAGMESMQDGPDSPSQSKRRCSTGTEISQPWLEEIQQLHGSPDRLDSLRGFRGCF